MENTRCKCTCVDSAFPSPYWRHASACGENIE